MPVYLVSENPGMLSESIIIKEFDDFIHSPVRSISVSGLILRYSNPLSK